jgi:hypothetical protein
MPPLAVTPMNSWAVIDLKAALSVAFVAVLSNCEGYVKRATALQSSLAEDLADLHLYCIKPLFVLELIMQAS